MFRLWCVASLVLLHPTFVASPKFVALMYISCFLLLMFISRLSLLMFISRLSLLMFIGRLSLPTFVVWDFLLSVVLTFSDLPCQVFLLQLTIVPCGFHSILKLYSQNLFRSNGSMFLCFQWIKIKNYWSSNNTMFPCFIVPQSKLFFFLSCCSPFSHVCTSHFPHSLWSKVRM